MIEVGKEYIFNYRVEIPGTGEDDITLCIINSGLNCKVIEDLGETEHGHLYEVESCTSSEFFAFESELDELKPGQISCF